MFCSKCGASNDNDAKVCTSCNLAFDAKGFQGEKTKEQVKAAMGDAWATFKALGLDPVGGLLNAYEGLGKVRSLGVGVAFGLAFALCFIISVYQIPYFKFLPNMSGIGGFIKLFIVGFVPFVALTAACIAGEKIGHGKGGIPSNGFIAGVALLPLGLVFLIASVVGVANIEVIGTIAIVGMCMTVLTLFAGLTRIGGVTEKVASISVPLMLIVSVWISKVILVSIFS